jgi:hypothetical protein
MMANTLFWRVGQYSAEVDHHARQYHNPEIEQALA